MCQIESKYLILLQEMKTPVCSEEQGPSRDVIAQLLEDALQVEGPEQPEQAFVKPHLVRYGRWRLAGVDPCPMSPVSTAVVVHGGLSASVSRCTLVTSTVRHQNG